MLALRIVSPDHCQRLFKVRYRRIKLLLNVELAVFVLLLANVQAPYRCVSVLFPAGDAAKILTKKLLTLQCDESRSGTVFHWAYRPHA